MPKIPAIFKALADDTRLRILNLLRQREICVCEIVDVLDLCQSKVSRHLATLKHAGLVTCRREGPWIYYPSPRQVVTLAPPLVDWLWVAKDQIRSGSNDVEALHALDRCDPASRPQPHAAPPCGTKDPRETDLPLLVTATRLSQIPLIASPAQHLKRSPAAHDHRPPGSRLHTALCLGSPSLCRSSRGSLVVARRQEAIRGTARKKKSLKLANKSDG